MKPEPRPYQVAGVEWLLNQKRAILADEAGLGKSRQLIEASVGQTLIVAPAMVLDGGTWEDEIGKWADDPSRFFTAPYTSLNARQVTPVNPATGKSGTKPLPKVLRDQYRQPWETIVLDEAHYVKGRDTSWTQAVKILGASADRLYAATGTPICNWAHELFSLLQCIYPDQAKQGRQFGSYWRWAEEWFDTTPTRYSRYNVGELRRCNWECLARPATDPCQHYHDFVKANLGDRFLQRRRDDVLTDLPPLTEVVVLTPMKDKQLAGYKSMKKDFLLEAHDTEVVAWSSGSQNVKLDRITTGLDVVDPLVFDKLPSKHKFATASNSKLNRLLTDLQNRSAPTIVMAHYRDSVEACAIVARSMGLRTEVVHGGVTKAQRTARVRDFQAGKVDVLVGSLETLAEGLTLVQADVLIFVEKSFKPSRNEQAMRRIHRLGQDRPVTILDYTTPDSVDSKKRELLATKTDRQMRMLTAAQLKQLL